MILTKTVTEITTQMHVFHRISIGIITCCGFTLGMLRYCMIKKAISLP